MIVQHLDKSQKINLIQVKIVNYLLNNITIPHRHLSIFGPKDTL